MIISERDKHIQLNFEDALMYCFSLGMRLPTEEELIAMIRDYKVLKEQSTMLFWTNRVSNTSNKGMALLPITYEIMEMDKRYDFIVVPVKD